jgi:GNAT superfamily N-acetyltransferase
VLAAAFYEDPVFGWLMPAERRRHGALRRFFEIELRTVGLARGTVWTTDEVEGAALSLPPGTWRLPWSVALRHGVGFARAFGARLPHAVALLQLMERRHVREPHHYFSYIGVVPARQGQGLGTRLMQPTLERCDAARLPAYLGASSERNAALYERLGFRLIDELTLGGSPPLLLMLRRPLVTRGTGRSPGC